MGGQDIGYMPILLYHLFKGSEHPQILVFKGGPGTNHLWIFEG